MNSKNNAKFQATWVDMMNHGRNKEIQKKINEIEYQRRYIENQEKKEFARNLRWLKENSEREYITLRRMFAFHCKNSSYLKYRIKTVVEQLKSPRSLQYNYGIANYNYNFYTINGFYDYSQWLYNV